LLNDASRPKFLIRRHLYGCVQHIDRGATATHHWRSDPKLHPWINTKQRNSKC